VKLPSEGVGTLLASYGVRAAVLLVWTFPWLLLVWHLQTFWTLSPNYQYGWVVLPLSIYLLFRRWSMLPAAGGRTHGANALAMMMAALLLPIWWVRVATPDWCVISYALAGTVIVYTYALMASRSSWSAVWPLVFPLCFILTAVPWPQRAEMAIIQSLTRIIAGASAEVCQWLGMSAVQQGNLISTVNGTVGISDACSGIRSIQSLLVATLALGEIYFLSVWRRLGLMFFGLALALLFNLLRNVILAVIGAASGIMTLERWHDQTGWAILLMSLPPLFLLARHWRAGVQIEEKPALRLSPLSRCAALAGFLWFSTMTAGIELWYRAHERPAAEAHRLEVRWPTNRKDFEKRPVTDRTRDILLCSNAESAVWKEDDGSSRMLTSLEWVAKQTSSQSARVHRPEVCFQATGAQFQTKHPVLPIETDRGPLYFESLEFQIDGRPVYVFYCLHEEANQDDRSEFSQTQRSRIMRAFHGQRNLGQQVVELTVSGFNGYETAAAAAKAELPALLELRAVGEPK